MSASFRPVAVAFLLAMAIWPVALPAQQRIGRTMQELPPLPDKQIHGYVTRILTQMDAFHADSSMTLINQALALADADAEARYYLLSYRAEVLYYEGLFNEGMRDLDRCADLALHLGDSTLMANVYNLKGLMHENIQDSRMALPHLRLALAWFPVQPAARYPVSELHHIHGNMGSYLTQVGELDSAAHHLQRSLGLAQQAGIHRAIAVAWWSLGNLALLRQAPDSALICYERSWREAELTSDHDIGVDAFIGKAKAQAARKDAAAARYALATARAYLDRHRAGIGLVTQRNFAREASGIMRSIGDPEGALRDLSDWHRMDSLITARNIHSALAVQADLLKADNELDLERIEKQRYAEALDHVRTTRWLMLGVGGIVFLALAGLYRLNLSRQEHKRRLAESELERERQERLIAELRVREQVGRDLHDDLGVGLSGLKLRSEMALLSPENTNLPDLLREQARMADELIGSMRHIIWALQEDQSALADLVAYASNYARSYLQDHGIAARVETNGSWPEIRLSSTLRRNCFLAMKEALHNVVKHAHATQVVVRFSWQQALVVEVIDDGRGLQPDTTSKGHGLRNMNKRMAHIGGRLEVSGPSEGGTCLRFTIPVVERKLS